jgi:hypothetical protein
MGYTVGKGYEEISTTLTCSSCERLQTKLIWKGPPTISQGLSQKYPLAAASEATHLQPALLHTSHSPTTTTTSWVWFRGRPFLLAFVYLLFSGSVIPFFLALPAGKFCRKLVPSRPSCLELSTLHDNELTVPLHFLFTKGIASNHGYSGYDRTRAFLQETKAEHRRVQGASLCTFPQLVFSFDLRFDRPECF